MKCLFWRSLFFLLFVLGGITVFLHPVQAATCSLSANTTIDADYVASSDCDIIALSGSPTITWSGTIDSGRPVAVQVNSGTVVFSGPLVLYDAASSVMVASGATLTHAAEDKVGVQITAPTVTVTGAINVNAKGCGSNEGVNGSGDCATGNPGAPGNNYSGGAYGGVGGSGYFTSVNTGTYGSSTNPTLLGSGGGQGGSNGGGRVGLVVSGTLTVDGSITANGAFGGGSGGSVYINAGTFNGTGTVNSNGGIANGTCSNGWGGGGGGRMAMYYGSGAFGFTDNSKITVNSGTGGCNDARNGTTFILDRQTDDGAGTLTFNGGGFFAAGGDYIRDAINIVSGSYLTCDTALTSLTVSSTSALVWPSSTWVCAPSAATSLSIGSNSSISLTSLTATFTGTMGAVKVEGASLTTSAVAWSLSGASSLALNVASFSNGTASTLTMSKAGSYTTFNTTGALTLNNFTYTGATAGTASGETGGHLIFPRNIDLTLTNGKIFASVSSTLASVSINSTSQISANGKGCLGAFGPNSSNVCTSVTAGYGASYGGAGHGGTGGTGYFSSGGVSYGSSTHPILFGSGTANGGAAGGGRVWLTVTGSLTNDGLITANGGASGGSGGSIYLNAATFAGTGNVSSTGAVGDGNIGCGAGGRIAMIASSFTFSGTSSTVAGATGCTGAAGVGTIYKLSYVVPTTPTLTAPISGIYNVSRTPTLTGSTYANSPYRTQTSADWKITSDALGSTIVWSSLGDTVNLSSITVNGSNGTFSDVLLGQASLAASTTYYGFVRYTNAVGNSSWSSASTFTTSYDGVSSIQTYNFDDAVPTSTFSFDATNIEINASSNGYARYKDLGSSTYAFSLGYSSSYSKVKKLTVTNQVASAFTNFQVKVTVAYDSDMQADFDDIRFTSSDGVTDIPFWLESKTNSVSAIFYVKLPSLPTSGTATIYMYYGNPDAASGSSGTDTFLFFDDFNDGNINGWTAFAAESGAVAPLVTAASNSLRINGSLNSNHEGGAVYGGYTFTNGIYEADVTLDTYALAGQETHLFARMSTTGANPAGYRFGPLWAGANDINLARETGHGNLANTSYTYGAGVSRKMSFTLSGSSLKGAINGTQYLTATDANYSSGYLGFVIDARHESQAAMQSTIDNVRVRQYASTEPTVGFAAEVANTPLASASVSLINNGALAAYGQLYRMEETLMSGSTGSVAYQLSKDGSSWKYWNGSVWGDATASLSQANSVTTVNGYLPLFAGQIGIGSLYVRMVFGSDGTQPVGLDTLKFYFTPSNGAPIDPSDLGQPSLVNGSTTSTETPTFSFTLADADVSDTVKYQIQIADSADFASPVVDYTSALAAQGEHTFQVGQATGTGTYTVGLAGQVLSLGNYYWRVKAIDLSEATSAYVVANAGAVAFVIDATARTIEFTQATETELEPVTATSVEIMLSTSHFEEVTVDYALSGTATGEGEDYTLASGTVTITAGHTTATIPIAFIDDAIDESDETLILTLSNPTGVNVSLGEGSVFTYTITDNDEAGVTVVESSGATVATEGGATDSFTVELTSQPTSTVQISFTTSTNGVTLNPGIINFTSSTWSTPITVTVTATDDAVSQGPHTGTITPSLSTTAYGYTEVIVTPIVADVTDNETAGIIIAESSGSTVVTEGGAADTFTLVLDTQPTASVEITLTTTTEGVTLSPGVVTFTTSNWNTPVTITVAATDDAIVQGAHLGTITPSLVTTAYGYSDIPLEPISVTVADDDTAGITITESSASTEVVEDGATDSFDVVLTSQPTSTVQISFTTSTVGVTLSLTTINFTSSNWNTPVTVTVTATDDQRSQGDHTGTITPTVLATALGYADVTLTPITAQVTDNDTAAVTIVESSGSTEVTEGGATDTFSVVLATQPTASVEVNLATTTNGVILSTSTLTFTTSNWNTPVTITVAATDDVIYEGSHVGIVTPTLVTTAYGYADLTLTALSTTITDNDTAGITITESSGSTEVTEGGSTDSFDIVLTSQPTSTVQVTFATSTNGAVASPGIINFNAGNWDTPVTVTITAADDVTSQGPHTGTITPSLTTTAFGYGSLSLEAVTANVTDNDTAGVTLTELGGSTHVTEAGATDTFTLVLDTQPTAAVEVQFATTTGVTVSPGAFTFTTSNWATPVTVTVTATDDAVVQGAYTASITPSLTTTAYGYSALSLTPVTTYITDNDVAGVTITESSATNVTEGGTTDSFTVVLTSQPTSTVQVLFATSTNSAILTPGVVSFNSSNWNTPVTVTVTAVNDDVFQGTHTGTITPSLVTTAFGYTDLALDPLVVTITDNDEAGISIVKSSGSIDVTEGGATDTFTLQLMSEPTSTVYIVFATTTQGVIVSPAAITLTSSNWHDPVTVTVTATDDAVSEGVHAATTTVAVSSESLGYADCSVAPIVATVTDNDTAAITIAEAATPRLLSEGGAGDTYTLVLTSEPTADVIITMTRSEATQFALSTSSVVFTPTNWNIPVTVTLSATDDVVDEPELAYEVTHTATSEDPSYEGSTIATIEGTITDNDTAGITLVGADDLVVSEGGTTDLLSFVLDTRPTTTVEISFATTTNGVVLSPATVSFTPDNWDTPISVAVTAFDDQIAEGAHHALITPSLSTTAYGYTAVVLPDIEATITDNDTAQVNFSTTTLDMIEGGSSRFYRLVLSRAPTSTVTIHVVPEAFTNVSTSTIVFTPVNWDVPVEVEVSAVDDATPHDTERFATTITHTVESSAYGYQSLSLPTVTVTVLENDVVISTPSGGGGGGGAAGGSAQGIAFIIPPAVIKPVLETVSPPPLIVIAPLPNVATDPIPAPLPNQQVVTILNPSDVVSLVQASNGGRDFSAEGKNLTSLQKDAKSFKIGLDNGTALTLTNFVTYGISDRTRALGVGERQAMIRDAFETMQTATISPQDLERLARGMIPEYRNKKVEIAQLPQVRATFKTMYGRDPNFKNAEENLAWNTLMYRIRFPRDLKVEKEGIVEFKKTFGKAPKTPFQWATVRALGYVQR